MKNKKFSLRQEGFSMTELLVGVGIMGAVTLGVTQLISNSSKQGKAVNDRQEFKSLIRFVSLELSKAEVCTDIFGGGAVNTPDRPMIQFAASGPMTKLNLVKNNTYLNDQYRLTNIATKPHVQNGVSNQTNFNLVLTFKNLRPTSGQRAEVVEILPIAADHDGTTINHCYTPNSAIIDLALEDADDICQGPGFVKPGDGTCKIKNIGSGQCPSHDFLIQVGFDAATFEYINVCSNPISITPNCPNNMIQSFNSSGQSTCVVMDNWVNQTPALVQNGSSCGLSVSNNKLSFTCNGGAPIADCNPTTNCNNLDRNLYCPSVNPPDGCGGLCPFNGTGTTGCEEPNECYAESCPTGNHWVWTASSGCSASASSCTDAQGDCSGMCVCTNPTGNQNPNAICNQINLNPTNPCPPAVQNPNGSWQEGCQQNPGTGEGGGLGL